LRLPWGSCRKLRLGSDGTNEERSGSRQHRRDQLLRKLRERGYLDPDSRHEQVAERLNLSRTAYFRRLRQASERLGAWLLERGPRA